MYRDSLGFHAQVGWEVVVHRYWSIVTDSHEQINIV